MGKSMSRNDIMEDLQQYMDDLESDLHRALEREEMWREQCLAMKQELLEVKGDAVEWCVRVLP